MKKIPAANGIAACESWKRGTADRRELLLAVRYQLQEFAAAHPGHAVEVRVPPAGAVQVLTGTTHRRGTPPAVVEMDMETWLALCAGTLTWEAACVSGKIAASGERSDLAEFFPVNN